MPLPSDPGGLVVRDHSAAAPPAQITTARARTSRPSSHRRPMQRPPSSSSVSARACSITSISGSCAARAESWRTTRRPVALPPECTTRRSECPPSSPSASAPAPSVSKFTPRRSRSRTRSGASLQSTAAAEGRNQPTSGALGVEQVALRAVVGPDRGREAALRPVARGLGERRRRDQRDGGAGPRGAQSDVQSSRSGTDDGKLGLDRRGVRHSRGTVQRWRPAVFFSHPASAGHDTGAHPERRERIVAIERHLEQTGWSGFERRDAPRVEREVLEPCHDAGYVAALERLCAVGGGQIDEDTVVSSGSFEAAMRAAGGAVAVVDVLLSGEAVAAFSAGRPPGHHALRARARRASACSTTSPSRRSMR